jgi:hypothetical protein
MPLDKHYMSSVWVLMQLFQLFERLKEAENGEDSRSSQWRGREHGYSFLK